MNTQQNDKTMMSILIGYIVMRNTKMRVGTPTLDGTKWDILESGFQPDYVKRRLYKSKPCAEEAAAQLKKNDPEDDFEVHPVYWHGR